MFTTIAGGLINWIATTILVESELTRPFREWLDRKRQQVIEPEREVSRITADNVVINRGWRCNGGPCRDPKNRYGFRAFWNKMAYVFGCHLCTGTWVGLVEAVILGPVIGSGVVGIILTGLLFKAVGHLILVVVNLLNRINP